MGCLTCMQLVCGFPDLLNQSAAPLKKEVPRQNFKFLNYLFIQVQVHMRQRLGPDLYHGLSVQNDNKKLQAAL